MTTNKRKGRSFWFDPKMSYKTFKELWKLVPLDGPVAESFVSGKIIWEMLRDRKINLALGKDDIYFSSKPIPKKALLISNPSK